MMLTAVSHRSICPSFPLATVMSVSHRSICPSFPLATVMQRKLKFYESDKAKGFKQDCKIGIRSSMPEG